MSLAFPKPDLRILERRDVILQGLAQLVAPEALITSEDERRAFETDIGQSLKAEQGYGQHPAAPDKALLLRL